MWSIPGRRRSPRGAELATRMGADSVVVAGGAEIYALALPQVQSIF